MNLTCATYNILRGYHRELVLKSIRFLIDEGADVICLQEAEVEFEHAMQEFLADPMLADWRIRYAHVGGGGNVALLWNTERLQLTDTKTVPLPKLPFPSRIERLKGMKDSIDRAALVGTFSCGGKTVQVTSAHIAWEGSARHRTGQMRHLREAVEKDTADFRIVAGDFNTIGLRALRRRRERRVERTLGEQYVNAFPRLRWSFDMAYTDPGHALKIVKPLYKVGIRFRNRLDYIFAANLQVVSATMHDLPGSDHRPLIATFAPAKTPSPISAASAK